MRGIAGECYAPERPARQRVLVDHGIFEDGLGLRDQLGEIEPIKTTAFVDRQEVRKGAWIVSSVPVGRVSLDLGGPVDQLVSVSIHVVDDWIDHDLAGE